MGQTSIIKIDFLKNHPHAIPVLAHIWHDVLGKIWMPDISIEEIQSLYYEELHQNMPLSFIALHDETPVASCTLTMDDGIRPDLGPWIADLVVDKKYQNQGIGKMLIDVSIKKAKQLGFEKIYLFVFDPATTAYYQRLGWEKIGMDEFKSQPVTVMCLNSF